MTEPNLAAPTVIVARRVIPGKEEEFKAWHERIRLAAGAYPGYVKSELQPPDAAHPGEWVTVYSFATGFQLDAWLTSTEREMLNSGAAHLIETTIREQRIAALRTAPEPVTVVFSQRIAAANHSAFLALYEEVAARLNTSPGFLGSDLFPPVGEVQQDYVIVASFRSRSDLDRWLESDDRHAWLDGANKFIEGERTMNVVGGFGGWFPSGPKRPQGPKKWKQAVAVLLALFPTALVVTLVRLELAPDLNVVWAVLIGNVIGVAALSFLLMPLVTQWLGPWLER